MRRYLPIVNAWRHLRRRFGDLIVVGLAVAAVIEIFVSDLPGSKLAFALAALAWTLPLLLRHRFPLVTPLVTTTGFAVGSFYVADQMQTTAFGVLVLIVAAWWMGAGNERRRAIVGLAAMYAGSQVTTAHFSDSISVGDVIFTALLVAAPWTAGQVVRTRAARAVELQERTARLEAERETSAQAAVADERTRIARELHDVVAHSISVMTIQAGAARLLLNDDPDRAEEALGRVEDTGRETLSEMRRLLGVLRQDMADHGSLEPRPSLEHVDALLNHYRKSGLDVQLQVVGAPSMLPPGIDLAAYRVVQEALTNTLKHAGPTRVSVQLTYSADAVQLDVVDDGRNAGTPIETPNGHDGGHGLVGMRERTAIYGGRLETGPRDDGGFAVSARFPLERDAA